MTDKVIVIVDNYSSTEHKESNLYEATVGESL